MRRYWWVVVTLALCGALLAWSLHQQFAHNWGASATILVENPQSSALFDRDVSADPERYTADQAAILQSTPVASRALEIANAETGADLDLDDAADGIEVESDLDSGSITVTASHPDPDVAISIANAVVTAYEEIKQAERSRAFDSAIEQFDSSIKTVDEELANITAQISELRASGGEGATDLDAQVQAATQRLLEILAQGTVDDTQVQPILDQLQTLQLIQALRGDDPVLASLIESRNQALERRSQLALRRDQLRVDSALTSTGISVISPAREAGQALSLPRALLIGLLLGTVIGAVVAFAFASRSKRFLHRSEPELVLNAPLLAEIPRYDGGRASIPTRDVPDTEEAEAYRVAEASLERLTDQGDAAQVAAVVSAASGDSSRVAANLAVTAALHGKKVLVIDCNLGDPALSRLLMAPSTREGLAEVVDGSVAFQDAAVSVDLGPGSHLDFLGKGVRNVSTPTFFPSKAAAEFFDQVADAYDLVVVDIPSPLQAAYAGSVARLCEQTVVVVPHESEVSVLADAMDRLAMSGGKADGYVYTESEQSIRVIQPDPSANGRQDLPKRVSPSAQV
jgi:Mrp family chromosome partitioning ATPase/uncharacterized protein involved in exopolysaccharide biosynthesis